MSLDVAIMFVSISGVQAKPYSSGHKIDPHLPVIVAELGELARVSAVPTATTSHQHCL